MRVLTLLGILCPSLYGQTATTTKDSLHCDPLKLNSLVGTVSLSLGTDRVVIGATTCVLKLWHENKNRGGLDFYLSNAFLSLMGENPPAFFSVMSGEPQMFHEWLGQLQDLSFTWSEEPPCDLEVKRKQLISILQHTEMGKSKAAALKELAISKLSSIRCRQID
jgi:hypothetical protein